MIRSLSRLSLLGLLLSAVSLPASATSYVPMTDEALVDQAPVAAVVQVRSAQPSARGAATELDVQVEEVLKGSLPGSSVIVRIPGVDRPNGLGLRVWGAPRFSAGERALLLLSPNRDGSYSIQQLMLGAFHEISLGGQKLALRNLSEAQAVGRSGQPAAAEKVRDFARFREWVAARAAGFQSAPSYEVAPLAGLSNVAEAFSLLTIGGVPVRWFDFDTGGSINWRANNVPLAGFNGGGYAEFQNAITAWNNEPQTPISYVYQGTTGATGGLDTFDGVNAILFNDPGDEIAGAFNCALGGVLAFGGPWFDSSIRSTFNSTTYIRSAGADIVVNDGVSCFLDNDAPAARELFAHELGHTLGLAHASENSLEPNATLRDALMYFAVHNDGRGASLRADDLAGIRSLYVAASPAKPVAPSGLTATATGLNQVRLVFTDNATNETEFKVEARPAGGVYGEVLTLGASAGTGATPVILVGGLTQNTTYTFRLRARNNGGFSAYSNEATATTFTTPTVCTPGANRLCLNNNRFAVDVSWATGTGSGLGTGVQLTPDTGYFWFFNSANVEMVVKVLDGCGLNGHYWVFAGGLTNTNVVMRVTDVTTGAVRTYTNPSSTPFQPIQDTSAFETCP